MKLPCDFTGANQNEDPTGHVLAVAGTVLAVLHAAGHATEKTALRAALQKAYVAGDSTLSAAVLEEIKTLSVSYVTATVAPR
jgi:hypothetical protein